ncbi:MAG: hypothetical protein JSS00_02195 [Proteobacteria bacterium]|nr:hypothetical protein [Pseudomonadota bacterium]
MRRLPLAKPRESDRMVGFTIPAGGAFYICDHDEVWRATIVPNPTIQATECAPYKFIEGRTDFLGLVFKGLPKNSPLFRVGKNEIAFNFDPKSDIATVNYSVGGQTGQIEFRTLSGDWFAASFSDDGRFLVLADPYDLAVYATS